MKKEALLILASLFLLIGAGCDNSDYFAAGNCNEISDVNKRIECQDNLYLEQAAKVYDKNLCSRIINPEIKENCMSRSFVSAGCENIIIIEGEEVCGDEIA